MYIIVNANPETPVQMSRKLVKAMGMDNGKNPCGFLLISKIKDSNTFVMIPKTGADTFHMQCSIVTPHPKRNRRTPAIFNWTIPSLEYITGITETNIINSKVIKVKEHKTDKLTYYELCLRR